MGAESFSQTITLSAELPAGLAPSPTHGNFPKHPHTRESFCNPLGKHVAPPVVSSGATKTNIKSK
jgi:hypothetical protein